VTSQQHLNFHFNPAGLLSVGDALSFVKGLMAEVPLAEAPQLGADRPLSRPTLCFGQGSDWLLCCGADAASNPARCMLAWPCVTVKPALNSKELETLPFAHGWRPAYIAAVALCSATDC